ncbi:hypothetical protein [Coleofasciculus sp. FACHB-1120]|uniref:hypothetical protein n=1 Tax=Coleofasciculus sp. FACHB-1120 TaxID=2692783 RepID=UPI0016874362|nr:hypothetical protein [Coleofasciculus sp. FACHB-1120]MBD2744048.1 hypothetical protein [Coleofasciculus sp. FACHB-1120]
MTQFPDDDKPLIEFLRQHRGHVPPSAPDLESHIMQAVASAPPQGRRKMWLLPSAIVASLLVTWAGYRVLVPNTASTASTNTAELEAFLATNWDSVVGETPPSSNSQEAETDWLLSEN